MSQARSRKSLPLCLGKENALRIGGHSWRDGFQALRFSAYRASDLTFCAIRQMRWAK